MISSLALLREAAKRDGRRVGFPRTVTTIAALATAIALVAPVTAHAQTTAQITVRARAIWTDTGVSMRPDQTYAIYGAAGTWSWYPGSYTGPDGTYHPGMAWDQWIPNGMAGELIGCILPEGMSPFSLSQGDSNLFEVGTKSLEFSGRSGRLWLGFNDDCISHNSGDNSGYVKVFVQRENRLFSLTFDPNPVEGGYPVSGAVTLRANAPSEGLEVYLSSSNSKAAEVPDCVTVPGGASVVHFPITTNVVFVGTRVTIHAETAGDGDKDTKDGDLDLEGNNVTLEAEDTYTVPGYLKNATVSLSKPPAKAVKLHLVIDKPKLATFENGGSELEVEFMAGEDPPSFGFGIQSLAAPPSEGQSFKVSVKERPDVSVEFFIHPMQVVDWNLLWQPKDGKYLVRSRNQAPATVTIDFPAAPGGTVVRLKSSEPFIHVPASITVPEGETESDEFTINVDPFADKKTIELSAKTIPEEEWHKVSIDYIPPVGQVMFKGDPFFGDTDDYSANGEGSVQAYVHFDGETPDDYQVAIKVKRSDPKSDSRILTLPATIVADGWTTQPFTISWREPVHDSKFSLIASTNGGEGPASTLSINGNEIQSFTLSPDTVYRRDPPNNTTTGTIKLRFKPKSPINVTVKIPRKVASTTEMIVPIDTSGEGTFTLTVDRDAPKGTHKLTAVYPVGNKAATAQLTIKGGTKPP